MRLKADEIEAIESAAVEAFGRSVVVSLFGSRVRDDLRGGDIDLLIEADGGDDDDKRMATFRRHLFDRIDEQKVDVVLKVRGRQPSAFARLIEAEAMTLS